MTTRNIVLTDDQQDLIESLVQTGRHQDAGEVLCDGLRLIKRRETEDAAKLAALRSAAEVGWLDLEAGRYRDVTAEGLAGYIGQLGARASKQVRAQG